MTGAEWERARARARALRERLPARAAPRTRPPLPGGPATVHDERGPGDQPRGR